MLKRIGAEESGEFKAIASGTLPSGKPVVVNSDGTVSIISETTVSESVGTPSNPTGAQISRPAVAYDANAQKVVIAYRDHQNSNQGYASVGTVSGTSISFGTRVQFESAYTDQVDIVYDTTAQKVVIAYQDIDTGGYGKAVVGTVSGTSISFGTPVVFKSAALQSPTRIAYHSAKNRVGIIYKNSSATDNGEIVIGEVSGTSLTFGSSVTFESGLFNDGDIVYDASAERFVTAHKDESTSSNGFCCVISVGGTGDLVPTVNTRQSFNAASTQYISAVYDSANEKVVISFADGASSAAGTVIVATIGSTSATFGTKVQFTSNNVGGTAITYDSGAGKVVVSYRDNTNSTRGTVISGKVSGTSVTFDTASVFDSNSISQIHNAYDANAEKVVTVFYDSTSVVGQAFVFQTGYTSTNLTSENYIGMSRGVAFQTGSAQSTGTEVAFDGHINHLGGTFDSNSNKIVFAYQDSDNSSFGTAVVGTISGTSISFGTPVVFHSANQQEIAATFDSTNNKVVIVYRDTGDSNKGKAIVGTVSGTSISFGSEVEFNDNNTRNTMSVVFDSSNDKVVVAYSNNSFTGRCKVGTVSGTSISFGSHTNFDTSGNIDYVNATFDSTNNKVIVVFKAGANSNRPTAIVGTVSETSISFGSSAEVSTESSTFTVPVFDPTEGKVVVFYNDTGASSEAGRAAVGTVSGTSISFGSSVSYYDNGSTKVANFSNAATYDSNSKKVVLGFKIASSVNHGSLVAGKVNGTTITFDDVLTFSEASDTSEVFPVYDSSSEKVGVAFRDPDNSNAGTGFVFKTDDRAVTRAEVTNGGNVSVDIIGSVSDNQIELTAGQQYYVQTDGTIGTTADSPSVLAGTAISATELLVKT